MAPSSASNAEVVVDPTSAGVSPPMPSIDPPPVLNAPPTFVPAAHGCSDHPSHLQSAKDDPNVLQVNNPRHWGREMPQGDANVEDEDKGTEQTSRTPSPATLRPDSTPPIAPAVTAYVSDDEEALPQQRASSPTQPQLQSKPESTSNTVHRYRPSIHAVEVAGIPLDDTSDTNTRPRRHDRYRGPGAAGAWWKKDPHPAFSHQSANRRVLVT